MAENGTGVDLTWGAIGLPDTVGYNVYRDVVANSPWGAGQKMNGSLVAGTSYPSVPADGGHFFFLIKAADACGNEAP